MGFFDSIFKKKPSVQASEFDFETYNRNNQATIDEIKRQYDMDTINGIRAIPTPTVKAQPHNLPNVVVQLEYILQRKATEHKKLGRMDLAIECLKKSNEIMPFSPVRYTRQDYERLVKFLVEIGETEQANVEQSKIDTLFGSPQISGHLGDVHFEKPVSTLQYNFAQMKVIKYSDERRSPEYLLEDENRKKAVADLLSLNGYLGTRKLTENMLKFVPSSQNGTDFVRIIVAPLSKAGKTPKYPFALYFMTAQPVERVEMFHGEIHYLKDGTMGKFKIIHTAKSGRITKYDYNFSTNTGKREIIN